MRNAELTRIGSVVTLFNPVQECAAHIFTGTLHSMFWNSWTKRLLLLLLLSTLPLQSGCLVTAVSLAAAGVATAQSAMEDVTERSYTQPYWCVYRATHAALHEMAIEVETIEQIKDGDVFHAKTTEYPVNVELSLVTENVTKVQVKAGKNIFQQDEATAAALADTIYEVIERNVHAGLVINPEQ